VRRKAMQKNPYLLGPMENFIEEATSKLTREKSKKMQLPGR
jgi:hypothetical protein